MNKDNLISVIEYDIYQKQAKEIASNLLMIDDLLSIKQFYYPYFYFKAECKMPLLYGRKKFTVNSMVDACSGHAATADLFDTKRKIVHQQELLIKRVKIETAKIKEKNYVIDHLNRKFKALGNYGISMKAKGEIYKLFWVLEYTNKSIVIDSITGDIEPLNTIRSA